MSGERTDATSGERPDAAPEPADSGDAPDRLALVREEPQVKLWLAVGGLALVLTVVAFLAVEPPPPDHLTIATGGPGGAYYVYGQRYRTRLSTDDVHLELLESAGSAENLAVLRSGEADLAFLQGGTEPGPGSGVVALAGLYVEPLWLFHRGDLDLERLGDLQGRRVAVGPAGSGTQVLARHLLGANGVDDESATLVVAPLREAMAALRAGEVDASFMVDSATAPLVLELLRDPTVGVMSFERAPAYARRYAFLTNVTLPRGVVDLARDLPAEDVALVAPTAILAAREDLHPAIQTLLLSTAHAVHERPEGHLVAGAGAFPTRELTGRLPVSEPASRYFREGPSFLFRWLPFWIASLIDRLKFMLLPLLTLVLPLVRIMPPIYRWRIRSRIYRWYQLLRAVDQRLNAGDSPEQLSGHVARLQRLELELISEVQVPLSYMEELYNLRLHLKVVLQKIDELRASRDRATGAEPPRPASGRVGPLGPLPEDPPST